MNYLKEERSRLGLTQEQVAEMCGVTGRTVFNWEKEKTKISKRKLELLAKSGLDSQYIDTGIRSIKATDENISRSEMLSILEVLLDSNEQQNKNIREFITKLKL